MACLDCGEPGACARCRDCGSCGVGGGRIRCKSLAECGECGACAKCGACWGCSGCDLCLDRRGRARKEQEAAVERREAPRRIGRSAPYLEGSVECGGCGACPTCAVPTCCEGVVTSARCECCGESVGCCVVTPSVEVVEGSTTDAAVAFKELYALAPGGEARQAAASEDAGGLETTLTAALSVSCGDLVRRHCTRVTTGAMDPPVLALHRD